MKKQDIERLVKYNLIINLQTERRLLRQEFIDIGNGIIKNKIGTKTRKYEIINKIVKITKDIYKLDKRYVNI